MSEKVNVFSDKGCVAFDDFPPTTGEVGCAKKSKLVEVTDNDFSSLMLAARELEGKSSVCCDIYNFLMKVKPKHPLLNKKIRSLSDNK